MKKALRWMLWWALAGMFLPALYLLRLFAPSWTISKPVPGVKPRLVWACAPIINIKYASEAMAQAGYYSKTFVYTHSAITEKRDFDLYRFEILSSDKWVHRRLVDLVEPYISFLYLLFHFDIVHIFYDGGVLVKTPLQFLETHLLHWFGKKIVVMPYGADVHVVSLMRNPVYKFGQLYHYGKFAIPRRELITRRINHYSKHADCCVGSANFDGLYRWDILPVSYVAIDTEAFKPSEDAGNQNDGQNGPVVIAHSPNHRVIKGTEYIIEAVDRLKSEGYQIDFRLLENLKNSEVKEILERSDILVELLVSGYGLSGIEGMALGKPVISNFQGDTSALKYYSFLNECPIVLANLDTVFDKLKWLVTNPQARKIIGGQSRKFVEKYHSYLAQQIMWEQVYRKIWHGEEVDLMLLYHPLRNEYTKLYNERAGKR